MEDSRIIELYFLRSEEAISQTAAKYGNYCFSIARNLLQDHEDAKEAVNDTYMGAWNAIPPHLPNSLAAFLGKITRRICVNRFLANRAAKRGGGETALALEELSRCIPSHWDIEKELEGAELSKVINCFVRELPDVERRVFVCRYWYIKPIKEIANQFGFSESKVKSMLMRTRNKLKNVLEKEGIFV